MSQILTNATEYTVSEIAQAVRRTVEASLAAVPHHTLLSAGADEATVCLLALDPSDLPAFGREVRRLASRGVVTRVEAEPHL